MYVAAFGGLQARLQQVVVCCLDGENLVDSRKDSVFVAYNWKHPMKLPSQHFCCTAFDCLSVSAALPIVV